MTTSLAIKDGNGSSKSLAVESGSYGLVPIHTISSSAGSGSYVTASATYPVYVTGAVNASVTTKIIPYSTINIDKVDGSGISWSPLTPGLGSASLGTFELAAYDTTRRGLIITNPGPNPLYIAMYVTAGPNYGLTILTPNVPPLYYSFILYPSGSYIAEPEHAHAGHGGYFVSASVSNILITENY